MLIEYAAIENARGGWLPQVWRDGKAQMHGFAPAGMSQEEASVIAYGEALLTEQRYAGDWSVKVRERKR